MPDTYHLQCATCGTVNRVPHARAADRGRCGHCGARLLPSHSLPIQTSDATWATDVLASTLPAVVEVWSPRCGVCADYEVSVRRMAASLFGLARVLQLNAEENPVTANRYGIRGVPTVLLFRGGELLATLVGPQGERGLRERLGV